MVMDMWPLVVCVSIETFIEISKSAMRIVMVGLPTVVIAALVLMGAAAFSVGLAFAQGDTEFGAASPSDCSLGVAVPDPAKNTGLVSDCEALLTARDTLAGSATLNWSARFPIDQWQGITLTGSPLRVSELNLWTKRLTGEIPTELGRLSNLRVLRLNSNQLTGQIPPELSELFDLETLDLYSNRLTGGIPAELGELANLRYLHLMDNQLTEDMPQGLTGLEALQSLRFYNNPGLCAPVDEGFQTWLRSVEVVRGSSCSSMDSAEDMAVLVELYNNLDGPNWRNSANWLSDRPIREWHGVTNDRNGRVTGLYLEYNRLDGEMPAELGGLANLHDLSLLGNRLTGEIPPELGGLANLRKLSLSGNQLTGEIPTEFGGLANLIELFLSSNQLTGEIPPEFGGLANLHALSLSSNQLTGEIPTELGGLTNLHVLSLSKNQLTGVIPVKLGNLTNLLWLYLDNNQLTGVIPVGLGDLSNLVMLELSANQLTGDIPKELGRLFNLQMLWLDHNQLTGEIPDELGGLTNLESLLLRDNLLTGPIPTGLGGLDNLQILHLQNNRLIGEIPAELGDLEKLFALHLSDNQLTGEIPPELADIPDLLEPSLMGNQLTGCIPEGLRYAYYNDLDELGLPFCDTALTSLSVGPRPLVPEFEPNHFQYTTTSGLSPVTVTSTDESGASVRVLDQNGDVVADADRALDGHQVDLVDGATTIKVEVTSADGQSDSTYTILVVFEDLADRYDVDDNGEIDRDEAITAVADYFNGAIGREEVLAVIILYFSSG